MPICPNCKEEIDKLNAYSEVVHSFVLALNGKPICYGNENLEGYTGFECPECYERIFDTEQEAIAFLGEDELQGIVKEKLKQMKEKK